jgi:hypothetical protein
MLHKTHKWSVDMGTKDGRTETEGAAALFCVELYTKLEYFEPNPCNQLVTRKSLPPDATW